MQVTHELSNLWKTQSAATSTYSDAIKRMSVALWEMISKQAPDRSYLFSPICEKFEEWIVLYMKLSMSEMRVGEDIRDCFERYKVIQRLQSERTHALKAGENAAKKLDEFEASYKIEAKKPTTDKRKMKATRKQLWEAKKSSLEKAKKLTEELIDHKKKFSKFQYSRTTHAYTTLAKDQTEITKNMLNVVQHLLNNVMRARKENGLLCASEQKNQKISESPDVSVVSSHAPMDVPVPLDSGNINSVEQSLSSMHPESPSDDNKNVYSSIADNNEPHTQAAEVESQNVEKIAKNKSHVFKSRLFDETVGDPIPDSRAFAASSKTSHLFDVPKPPSLTSKKSTGRSMFDDDISPTKEQSENSEREQNQPLFADPEVLSLEQATNRKTNKTKHKPLFPDLPNS